MHGVLVVNKPVGPSSHDVVVVARRSLGMSRIGHTGTLDPQASGVLPLVLGQATRLAQHLTGSDKEYEATLRFGVVTDTYDASGAVVEASGQTPPRAALEAALAGFRGTFPQMPPAYSAKMIDGERSYVRARAGKPTQSTPAVVTAMDLELVEYAPPLARVRVRCSAGFYVRSLAHDLGVAAGTGAILEALTRTEAAGYGIEEALPFERLVTAPRPDLFAQVKPMESLLLGAPTAAITSEGVDWVQHGRDLGPRQLVGPLAPVPALVRLIGPDGRLVGLAGPAKPPGLLHPAVVFRYS